MSNESCLALANVRLVRDASPRMAEASQHTHKGQLLPCNAICVSCTNCRETASLLAPAQRSAPKSKGSRPGCSASVLEAEGIPPTCAARSVKPLLGSPLSLNSAKTPKHTPQRPTAALLLAPAELTSHETASPLPPAHRPAPTAKGSGTECGQACSRPTESRSRAPREAGKPRAEAH